MPNELLRGPLFAAKNHNEPRLVYLPKAPLVMPVIGGGELRYAGEELRQDDETVWMQLVHMARTSRSEWISFTPKSLIEKLRWALKEPSYERLLTTLRRLKANSLEFYSARINRGVSTSLIVDFEYSERGERRGGRPWRVHVFSKENKLFFLFDSYYSRLDWETRLSLPVGAATWLHGFFATHRQPHPHKVETLIIGAAERVNDFATPCFMNLLCKVGCWVRCVSPVVAG